MKKAIVTIVKRVELDSKTNNPIFKEIFESSYNELETVSVYKSELMKGYSLDKGGHNTKLKTENDNDVTGASMNAIFKFKKIIPELTDTSKRIYFKIKSTKDNSFSSVKVEVVEFVKSDKDNLRLAVYFETEPMILLDSVGDKLLLSFPNNNGEDDATQTDFANTFFVQLTEDIYFQQFKLL